MGTANKWRPDADWCAGFHGGDLTLDEAETLARQGAEEHPGAPLAEIAARFEDGSRTRHACGGW